MRMSFSTVIVAAVLVAGLAPTASRAQELDRLLVRVNGAVLMSSDVRQARALKLVAETGSDESTQRALENRLLMLGEVGRGAPVSVSDDELNARRQRWASSVGPDAEAQLARHGMNRAALDAWLRDDARIEAYVRQTFGDPADPAKARSVSAWVDRLRQRAGLR
jgi:hypothetical protein